ncbi:MAG: hypothetical protein QOE45_2310 [Frankiaceae bacterium]|jgi:hypothetical protein|nr:hypothetical protein [Frankiaceae bacterium]
MEKTAGTETAGGLPADVVAFLYVRPRSLGLAALGERLVALEQLVRRAAAAQADAVREFAARDGADAFGSPSTACWLQEHTGVADRESRALVGLARTLGRLPAMAAALRSGAVTVAHVRVLSAQTRHVPAAVVAEAEPFLVTHARRLDSARYLTFVKHWVATAAAATYEADSQRRYDARWLSVAETYEGMGSIQGMLDPEGYGVVSAALEAMLAANPYDDARTRDQQRADALVELVELARSHDLVPTTGAHRPEIVVHAPASALAGNGAADVGPAGPPVLADSGPLPPAAFERLACDARWRRLVLDPAGVPLSLGRATRQVPASLRKFVALRDGHCRYPGCRRRAAFCEVHHVVHWRAGGRTDAANLALLCRYHHHLVHDRAHALVLHPDGTLDVTRPDGTILTSRPRGPTGLVSA